MCGTEAGFEVADGATSVYRFLRCADWRRVFRLPAGCVSGKDCRRQPAKSTEKQISADDEGIKQTQPKRRRLRMIKAKPTEQNDKRLRSLLLHLLSSNRRKCRKSC